MMAGATEARFIDVAIDGNDIYFGNLYTELPGYVKGTIDGDKVILPSYQYIGLEKTYNYFTFIDGGKEGMYKDPYTGETYPDYLKIDELVLSYDAASQTITSAADEGLFVNVGMADYIYYVKMYAPLTIKSTDPNAEVAAPKAPVITYVELDPEYGFNLIYFDLPQTDINDNLLDINRLYYNFFVDGDVFTFYPDEYFSIEEEMTDIPYTFSDAYEWLIIGGDSPAHEIAFFFSGADSIGLQQFYLTEDGEKLMSEYVEYALSSAPSISSDAQVLSTAYYDLQGRKVANPAAGLFIQVDQLSNGARVINKIAK